MVHTLVGAAAAWFIWGRGYNADLRILNV